MTATPRIDAYNWAGGREAMLRFGPDDGPVAVMALPLFEEANRTRAFGNAILRSLAKRGIAGALPDLPGQGDSLVPLETVSLSRIEEGYAGAIDAITRPGQSTYAIGIRSGAMLDASGLVTGRWYLAPQSGPELLVELNRMRRAATGRPADELWSRDGDLPPEAPDTPVEIAGNLLSTALLTDLTVKRPWTAADGGPVRVVRLDSDARPADRVVAGSPLWRRSEPGSDPDLAAILADDIAAWIARCEG